MITWPGFRGKEKDGLHACQDEKGDITLICNVKWARELHKRAESDGFTNPLAWLIKMGLPNAAAEAKAAREVVA